MAVDERARHERYEQAEAAMGRDSADTLMSLLPPVGWADVATKHDLSQPETLDARIQGLGDRLDGRIDGLGARFDGLSSEIRAATSDRRASVRGDLLRMTVALLAFVVALVVPLVTLT